MPLALSRALGAWLSMTTARPARRTSANLYVSSTSTVVKVVQNDPLGQPDDTTNTTVVSGLSSAAGLYFDDSRTLPWRTSAPIGWASTIPPPEPMTSASPVS